jgi:hypothetical protein
MKVYKKRVLYIMCFLLLNHNISYIFKKTRWQRSKQINNKLLSRIFCWYLIFSNFYKLKYRFLETHTLMKLANATIQIIEKVYLLTWALWHLMTSKSLSFTESVSFSMVDLGMVAADSLMAIHRSSFDQYCLPFA